MILALILVALLAYLFVAPFFSAKADQAAQQTSDPDKAMQYSWISQLGVGGFLLLVLLFFIAWASSLEGG